MPVRNIPIKRKWYLGYPITSPYAFYKLSSNHPVTVIVMNYKNFRRAKDNFPVEALCGSINKTEAHEKFLIPDQFSEDGQLYVMVENQGSYEATVRLDVGGFHRQQVGPYNEFTENREMLKYKSNLW